MGKLLARVKRAVEAFKSPGLAQYAATSVRPMEAQEGFGRRQQYQHLDLMTMFSGIVKVCASRNAAGIASNPLKLYRHKKTSTAFSTRRLRYGEVQAIKARAGLWACKALDQAERPEQVTDPLHPINAILRDVNPFNNAYDTMEALVVALGMCGNGYWKIARDASGMPVELWPLWPQFVHIIPSREKVIGSYVYGRGTETEQHFDPVDVVHFRYVNPRGDPYYGAGDMAACVSEARLGFEIVAMAQATVDNGGQPGWLIWGPMGDDQRKQLEISLQSKSAGARNAGRHIILSAPETVKCERALGNESEKGLLSVPSAERFDEVVCNVFDVPVELARMKPGGLSGNSQAVMQWQTYGLQPRGRKIEDILNAWIQREAAMGAAGWDGLFVCYDAWVQEDESVKHPLVVDAWNADLTTKNEARMKMGYEVDTDDPDADKYKSQTASAQEERANAAKQPEIAVPASKSADLHGDRGATPLAIGSRTYGTGKPLGIAGAAGVCLASLILAPQAHACCCTHTGKELSYNTTADEQEKKMDAKIRLWLLALMLDIDLSVTESGAVMDIASSAQARAGFDAAAGPEIEASIRAGIQKGATEVAESALRIEAEKKVAEQVTKQLDRAWESVSKTLQNRVETSIAKVKEDGGSLFEMRAAAKEAVQQAAEITPEAVSGFEVGNAYMMARERVWVDSGVEIVKRWKTAKNPCPVCIAMAAIYNSMDLAAGEPMLVKGESTMLSPELGLLTASYADLYGPPLHNLCRCWLVPVIKGKV